MIEKMEPCSCDIYYAFKCYDCAACTDCTREYYMVTDEVWLEGNPKGRGMLCIGCLELRINRLLTKDDFTACPLNSMNEVIGSTRLRTRLTNVAASAIF